MNAQGTIKTVLDLETFDSGFKKRSVILEIVDGKYTNLHGFQFFKERSSLLDGLQAGDVISVDYNLGTAREYNGRWYAEMPVAWKLEVISRVPRTEQPAAASVPPPVADEDIPF